MIVTQYPLDHECTGIITEPEIFAVLYGRQTSPLPLFGVDFLDGTQ